MLSSIHDRGCICMQAACGSAQPDGAIAWSTCYRNIHQTGTRGERNRGSGHTGQKVKTKKKAASEHRCPASFKGSHATGAGSEQCCSEGKHKEIGSKRHRCSPRFQAAMPQKQTASGAVQKANTKK
eukprot:1159353-Pelagomonas_calceolata.AAC.3